MSPLLFVKHRCVGPLSSSPSQLVVTDTHRLSEPESSWEWLQKKNAPRHTRALSNLHIHGHGTSALSHHQPLCCGNVSRSFMRTNVFCFMVGGAFQASIVFLFYGTRRACKELAPRMFWRENTQITLSLKISRMVTMLRTVNAAGD